MGKSSTSQATRGASGGAIARNAFHLVLGQIGTTALAVMLSAALGRWLGAADFGLFFLVTSMATFAFVVVDWGQSQYVIREVARLPDRAGDLLATTLALRVAGTALMALFTAGTAFLLGYDLRTCLLAALLMGTMLPFFLAQAYGLVFRGLERMDLDALVSVVNKVLVLAITVTALLSGGGLLGAILSQGAAGAGALGVAAFLMRRRMQVSLAGGSRGAARELLRGGTPLMLMAITVAAHSYLDAVVLSKLASAEEMGWFGAARNIFGTLVAPATILATASFPALSRAAHDPAALRREMQVAMRPLLGLAALAGVGTYLFAGFAVNLIYGEDKFAPAATILQVFAPGLFLLFLDMMLGIAVVAVGRTRSLAVGKILNVIVATSLGIVLVPVFQRSHGDGGMGIAAAFAASELIMFVTAAVILPRGTLQPAMALDAGRALAAAGGTLLLFRALPGFSPLLGIPACVLVFATLAAAVGLVRGEEIAKIRGMLRRRSGATEPAA